MDNKIIKVDTKTSIAQQSDYYIGTRGQNLQNKLIFEMSEKIKGVAWLEYEVNGKKYFAIMQETETGYEIDIKSCLLEGNQVSVDLRITEDPDIDETPIFVSTVSTFKVHNSIGAVDEEPEQYPSWLKTANEKIREMDNLNIEVEKEDKVTTITKTNKDGSTQITEIRDGEKGDSYVITEDDYNSIANIVEQDIKPTLDSNLKSAKDYTDNAIIRDIKEVQYDEDSATFTFTRHDETKVIVDLPIEQLLKNGYYDDETKELVLVMENDQEIRIPATGLIDDYSTEDSDTIQLNLSAKNVFTAILKGHSVKKTHLDLELQKEIDSKVTQDDIDSAIKNLVDNDISTLDDLISENTKNIENNKKSIDSLDNRITNIEKKIPTEDIATEEYVDKKVQGLVDNDIANLTELIEENQDNITNLENKAFTTIQYKENGSKTNVNFVSKDKTNLGTLTIINSLESEATNAFLGAGQGKIIDGRLKNIEENYVTIDVLNARIGDIDSILDLINGESI